VANSSDIGIAKFGIFVDDKNFRLPIRKFFWMGFELPFLGSVSYISCGCGGATAANGVGITTTLCFLFSDFCEWPFCCAFCAFPRNLAEVVLKISLRVLAACVKRISRMLTGNVSSDTWQSMVGGFIVIALACDHVRSSGNLNCVLTVLTSGLRKNSLGQGTDLLDQVKFSLT
jgi:hypothetical protein